MAVSNYWSYLSDSQIPLSTIPVDLHRPRAQRVHKLFPNVCTDSRKLFEKRAWQTEYQNQQVMISHKTYACKSRP